MDAPYITCLFENFYIPTITAASSYCITFLLIKNMLDKDGPEVDQVSVRDELIAVDDVVRQVHLEGKPYDVEVRK